MEKQKQNGKEERPPVIVITGHIDHGKSTLLDYIRKTNTVEGEAGGITQRTSAYEVVHEDQKGNKKKITFLDTPGHEAFSGMRERGVIAADIAILVISAEDGVKAQTIEALKTILTSKVPFIVAINKIDKQNANPEKVKSDLLEQGVYVEGYGGSTPWVPISAKIGTGIPELLDMILLVAEMEELKGDSGAIPEGLVIESHVDPKRGISATLLVKNGTLVKGMQVVAEDSIAPARLIEDFVGKPTDKATLSSPVSITGFSSIPKVGATWRAFEKKKDAEEYAEKFKEGLREKSGMTNGGEQIEETEQKVVPLIIKADAVGTLEAVQKELGKIKKDGLIIKVVGAGVGAVSESDVRLAQSSKDGVILSFGVKIDKNASDLALQLYIPIQSFDIIYKMSEWLEEELEKRRPRVTVEETIGKLKILKVFSKSRDKQVIGGRVLEGSIRAGASFKIMRRDFEIGRGEINELQEQKKKVREVLEGHECGIMAESKTEIAPGDVLEAIIQVTK